MKRPFCIIGGSFLTAAFLASFLNAGIQAASPTACILAFFTVLFFFSREKRVIACTALCSAALAFGLFLPNTLREEQVLPLQEQTVEIHATVKSITSRGNQKYSYQIGIEPSGSVPVSFESLLYTNQPLEVEISDQITLPVRFFAPDTTSYFDGARYYRGQHILLLSYYDGDAAVTVTPAQQRSFRYYVNECSRFLRAKAEQYFSPEAASILNSMLLGDRSGIPFALKQNYTDAGVVHLLAISGVHVAILSGALFLLLRLFRVPRRLAVILQMTATIGFVVISGMSGSAMRAGGMILILQIGRLCYRRADSVNSLCCAGFFIVLCDIYAIMDIGLLMSISATLGILLCAKPCQDWVCRKLGLTSPSAVKITGLLSLTFSANLFLLPVYFASFGTISLIAPISNLFTTATASVIIAFGIFVLLFVAIPTPEVLLHLLTAAEQFFIDLQNGIARFFGSLPFASMGLDYPALGAWFVICLLFLVMGLLFWKRRRLAVPFLLFSVCFFLISNALSLLFLYDTGRVAVIGDGTTSNVVFIDRFQAIVFSCSDDDYIDESTYRYLKRMGVHQINTLVLLYPDFEEYQDTVNLAEAMPVQNLLYNPENTACRQMMEEHAAQIQPIGFGSEIQTTDGFDASFTIHDHGEKFGVQINYHGYSMLLSSCLDELRQTQAQTVFVSGSVTDLTEIKAEHLILLEKQWRPVLCDQLYETAKREAIQFEIKKDGICSRIH